MGLEALVERWTQPFGIFVHSEPCCLSLMIFLTDATLFLLCTQTMEYVQEGRRGWVRTGEVEVNRG